MPKADEGSPQGSFLREVNNASLLHVSNRLEGFCFICNLIDLFENFIKANHRDNEFFYIFNSSREEGGVTTAEKIFDPSRSINKVDEDASRVVVLRIMQKDQTHAYYEELER